MFLFRWFSTPQLHTVPQPSAGPPPCLTGISGLMMHSGKCHVCGCPGGSFPLPPPSETGVSILSVFLSPCSVCGHPAQLHDGTSEWLQSGIAQPPRARVQLPYPSQERTYPRTPFVTELVRRMQVNRFVVVRGTPAIGKTTILEQTANYFLKHHAERPLFVITGWDQDEVERAGGWELHLRAITGISGQTWRATEAVLLLDEGQCSYWDLNLWSVFFKAVHGDHGSGPWVALFASYGSPGGGYAGLDENRKRFRPTPIRLGGESEITIREKPVVGPFAVAVGLLLKLDETASCLRHILSLSGAMFTNELITELAAVSGGHLGILSSMIDVIVKRTEPLYRFIREQKEITLLQVREQVFQKPSHLFRAIENTPCARGFPTAECLRKPDIATAFVTLIENGGSAKAEAFHHSSLQVLPVLVENGWVHVEEFEGQLAYLFVSNIHRSYCAYLLLQIRDAPREFEDLQSLVIEAVKRFNAAQLRDPRRSSQHAAGEEFFPFEDQWQKEFYRIAFGFGIVVSPEYRIHGRGSTIRGRVDFKIGDKKWAIEMVRQGNNLDEHAGRFVRGGAYYPEVRSGLITDWLVLNVTNVHFELIPDVHEKHKDRLIHAIFTSDYTTVKIVSGNGAELGAYRTVP